MIPQSSFHSFFQVFEDKFAFCPDDEPKESDFDLDLEPPQLAVVSPPPPKATPKAAPKAGGGPKAARVKQEVKQEPGFGGYMPPPPPSSAVAGYQNSAAAASRQGELLAMDKIRIKVICLESRKT